MSWVSQEPFNPQLERRMRRYWRALTVLMLALTVQAATARERLTNGTGAGS